MKNYFFIDDKSCWGMRFNTLFTILILTLGVSAYGQTEKYNAGPNLVANIDHYMIDFEIQEMGDQPDTAYVNSLNWPEYEKFRMRSEDRIVHDLLTGYTIIIYSVDKAAANRQEILKAIEEH